MTKEMAKFKTDDTPLTLATIQAFRDMLDVMEEFIRNTEQEERESYE
jgi:hypothetical protein